MIWKKYILETENKDMELVTAILMENGVVDIQIENNVQLTDEELNQMYADFAKELPEDDGTCRVTFYLDGESRVPGEALGTGDSPTVIPGEVIDVEKIKADLDEAAEVFGIGKVTLSESDVRTEDWESNWKNFFRPFEVDGIVIKPTWETVEPEEGKVIVDIDPGMAFGTGTHETTRLCLKGLKKYMKKGDKVLDLGCGSGILGIAALKLGASGVESVDIDEQAVRVAEENFELNFPESYTNDNRDSCISDENVICCKDGKDNGISDVSNKNVQNDNCLQQSDKKKYNIIIGNIIEDLYLRETLASQPCEIVMANILAEVVAKLLPFVHTFMKPGAYLITSGILAEKEQLVVEAASGNPEIAYVETVKDGDWVSVVFKKNHQLS